MLQIRSYLLEMVLSNSMKMSSENDDTGKDSTSIGPAAVSDLRHAGAIAATRGRRCSGWDSFARPLCARRFRFQTRPAAPRPQVKYRTKARVSQNVIFSMEPKRELVSPAVPRRAVQPPSSHRTLPQPSRMAEYAAAGLGLSPPRQYLVWAPTWDRDSSSVPPASYYEATPWWGATPHTVRLLGVRVQSRTVNTAKEKERFRR